MCIYPYFWNFSAKTSSFWPKKIMGRSYTCSLEVYIVSVVFGECLCSSNFERDIVDTLCHASRRSDTTRPNKAGFLLQEGRVWRVGQPGMQFRLVWPSKALYFGEPRVSEQVLVEWHKKCEQTWVQVTLCSPLKVTSVGIGCWGVYLWTSMLVELHEKVWTDCNKSK
jgi:hypothetical protein